MRAKEFFASPKCVHVESDFIEQSTTYYECKPNMEEVFDFAEMFARKLIEEAYTDGFNDSKYDFDIENYID